MNKCFSLDVNTLEPEKTRIEPREYAGNDEVENIILPAILRRLAKKLFAVVRT